MGNKILLISDIAKVKGGKRLPKGVRLQKERNSHPYIRVKDFGPRTLELDDSFEYVDSVTQKLISQYTVNEGDVLLSIVGTIGLVGIVGRSLDQANLTENCVKIFGLDSVDSKFLYYYLVSSYGQREISNRTVGAVQAKLPIKNIKSMPVYFPSRGVRERIVSVLSSLDTKIEINNRINDYLLELLKASAKNLYADYERNEDLELSEGWRWVEIDEIAEMVCRGITPKYNPDSDETVLGQTCVRNNLVLLENGRLHMPKKVTEKWLQKYDLLINSTGVGSLGRTAQVWFEPSKLVVDSHVTIVRCENAKHALYLGFWAFEHEKYIESLHTGSTGQTELPRDHVKAIRFVLPSEEELEKFNAIAVPAVELIVANQRESKRLAELRDALLPKLMSGEIDVSKVDLTQLNNHLCDCSALPFF